MIDTFEVYWPHRRQNKNFQKKIKFWGYETRLPYLAILGPKHIARLLVNKIATIVDH